MWGKASALLTAVPESGGLLRMAGHQSSRRSATRCAVQPRPCLRRGSTSCPFRPEGLDEARELWWDIFGRASRLLLEPLVAGREAEVHPNLAEFLEWTRQLPKLTAERLLEVEIRRDLLRTRFLQQMEGFPVLLCPVSAVPAFRHGERTWRIEGRDVDYLDAWSYAAWFNLLQNPAVSVPAGLTPDGLPIGVQVVARHWEEMTALGVAREIERALGAYAAPGLDVLRVARRD